MHDVQFVTQLDDQNRIPVPAALARKIPPHARVSVQLRVESKNGRRTNGALDYYMEHGIDMPGILLFDRDALYSDVS